MSRFGGIMSIPNENMHLLYELIPFPYYTFISDTFDLY